MLPDQLESVFAYMHSALSSLLSKIAYCRQSTVSGRRHAVATIQIFVSDESSLPNREKPSFDGHENMLLRKSRKRGHASDIAYVGKAGPVYIRIDLGL